MRFLCVRKIIYCVFMMFFLSACANGVPAVQIERELANLADAGVLLPINPYEVQTQNVLLYEVRLGNIERTFGIFANVVFPRQNLHFSRTNGDFSGLMVSPGQRVAAGDVIAALTFDTEALEIERASIVSQINNFEVEFRERDSSRQSELAALRLRLEFADTGSREHLVIQLALEELSREQFLFESNITRQNLQERLLDIDTRIAGDVIFAPFCGVIISVTHITPGTFINTWPVIATIIDDSNINFTISGGTDVIRFGDVFTIQALNWELNSMDVRVVSDPLATGRREPNLQFTLVPVDPHAMAEDMRIRNLQPHELENIRFRADIQVYLAINSVLVNRRAVLPEDIRNFVFVYEDGRLMKRYVEVGVRFDSDIQILSGLYPGQKVVLVN